MTRNSSVLSGGGWSWPNFNEIGSNEQLSDCRGFVVDCRRYTDIGVQFLLTYNMLYEIVRVVSPEQVDIYNCVFFWHRIFLAAK